MILRAGVFTAGRIPDLTRGAQTANDRLEEAEERLPALRRRGKHALAAILGAQPHAVLAVEVEVAAVLQRDGARADGTD